MWKTKEEMTVTALFEVEKQVDTDESGKTLPTTNIVALHNIVNPDRWW